MTTTSHPPHALHDYALLADTLFKEAAASSVHPHGYWQRAPDDTAVDAALLPPALRGALPQAFVHALLLETAARLAEEPGLRSTRHRTRS